MSLWRYFGYMEEVMCNGDALILNPVKTALAGSVSRTPGSSGGAGGAGTNTGPIRPGAYGRPAPRFVELC